MAVTVSLSGSEVGAVCGVGCVCHRAKVQIRLSDGVAGRAGDLPQWRQSRRSVRAGHCGFVIHNCDVIQRYIAAVGHQVAVADDVAHCVVGRRCGGLDNGQSGLWTALTVSLRGSDCVVPSCRIGCVGH